MSEKEYSGRKVREGWVRQPNKIVGCRGGAVAGPGKETLDSPMTPRQDFLENGGIKKAQSNNFGPGNNEGLLGRQKDEDRQANRATREDREK